MARIELANDYWGMDDHEEPFDNETGPSGSVRLYGEEGGDGECRVLASLWYGDEEQTSRAEAWAAARRFAASYYITDAAIESMRTQHSAAWVAVTQGGDRDYVTRRLAGAFYDFQRACQPPEPKPAADTKADKLAALVRDVASSLRAAGDKGRESAQTVEGRLREILDADAI